VALETPPGVARVDVETAQQMYDAVFEQIEEQDLFAACAAVADYRPAHPQAHKIKKSSDILALELIKNPDILAAVAALEGGPWTLGFAAETEGLLERAKEKLVRKGVDMVAANLVGGGRAFGTPDNALEVVWKGGHVSFHKEDKIGLARRLVALIVEVRDAVDS